MRNLPTGWSLTNLVELAKPIGGGTPAKSNSAYWKNGTIPWISPKDMKRTLITSSEDRVTEQALSSLKLIPSDSILIVVRSGILSHTLPVATNSIPVTINQDMRAFAPYDGVSASFVKWQIIANQNNILSSCSKNGTTVSSIEGPALSRFPILIAPANEQLKIVAKLEELLSELDAGVAELRAAQKKLHLYRQSLLKAAAEGSLTAEWRTRNTPQETGAELLARILKERRVRWEEKHLSKFKEQGKTPPKGWQNKYPEPVAPDISGLPELPEGWVWATLSQVGWLDRGRSKHRPRNAPHLYGGPYPFVQTGDIRHSDTFISQVQATYSEAGLAQSCLWPAGTMCITIAANIGKTAILAIKACFPDSVVGFLPSSDVVTIRYVEYFMRSIQLKLENEAPATAQKNINLEILEKVSIPIPPTNEQIEIVEILDNAFIVASNNNFTIEKALKQSAAQRQNILRAAFVGELVPQDPCDEPARVLLERIQTECGAPGKSTTKRRGRKPKATA